MALTVAETLRSRTRNRTLVVANVTFDSSYPTGGEDFTPGLFGLKAFDYVSPATTGATDVVYDAATGKLKTFVASSGLEAANATNLSTLVVPVMVIGS